MQLAVHILAYNVSRFLPHVIENVAPFVDKIFLAYPRLPFAYIPKSRLEKTNPTTLEELTTITSGTPIEIVEGDWLDEESMRNACLDRARSQGFDWLIIQDADEFYPEETWLQIRKLMLNAKNDDHLTTTSYNFWKSSYYVIVYRSGNIKHATAGFAIRCRPDTAFINKRLTNVSVSKTIDCACYHYGYALTDQEMEEKLQTWSHAHQFNTRRWFEIKWLNWRLETKNIDQICPPAWKRAVRFPFHQPEFAHTFALPIMELPKPTIGTVCSELAYDGYAYTYDMLRRTKRLVFPR